MWVLTEGYCSITGEKLYAKDMYHVPGDGLDRVDTRCRCHDKRINHVQGPGRELDFLVAEAIGMRRVEEGTDAWWPSPNMVETLKEIFPDAIAVDYMPAPHFSTNFDHAWVIIETLKDDWEIRLSYKEENGSYYCYLYGLNNKMGEGWSKVSVQHAICLAVLKTTIVLAS